jgi:hypothetical protein
MSHRHHWKPFVTGRARQPVPAARWYLATTMVLLALAAGITLVAPRALSNAASTAATVSPTVAPNDGRVTWNPDGNPVQGNDGGACETAMSGTVSGPDPSVIAQVDSVLNDEAADSISQDDIADLKVSAPVMASGTSMTVYADADIDCSAVNQATAYIRKAGDASPARPARAVRNAPAHPDQAGQALRTAQRAALLSYELAPWLKIAIAAVAGAVVFAAVSVAVTAALTALILAASTAFAPATLALVAGCVAGLAAGPVAMAIATTGNLTVSSGLDSALAGCFAGSIISSVAGLTWISAAFQSLGWTSGSAIARVVGQAIASDATATGAVLTSIEVQLAAIAAAA